MKKLLTSLLLLVACNEILARSVMPRHRRTIPYGESFWDDYDYDLFNLNDHDFTNFGLAADSDSEQSREALTPSPTNYNDDANEGATDDANGDANDDDHNDAFNDDFNDFFGNLLGSILSVSDDSMESDKITPTEVDDIFKNDRTEHDNNENNNKSIQNNDDDEADDDDKKVMEFEIHISNIFLTKDPNSSEEKKNEDKVEENKSSEETLFSFIGNDKSDENTGSNEMNTNNIDGIEMIDLTKSSEEEKHEIHDDDHDADDNHRNHDDINENDIKDLSELFVTLNILEDLMKISDRSRNPANNLKAKEVDQYLKLFSDVLDKAALQEMQSIEKNKIVAKDNDKTNNFTTLTKESDEEDNRTTTTPKNDSNENDSDGNDGHNNDNNNDDDDNDDKNNKNNTSDSNEDDSNLISLAFYEVADDVKQRNLNDHKYAVVESYTQDFTPTSAPFLPEMHSTSNSDNQNAIHQYVEIRENLDTEQHSLQDNEINLDKDFYTIIASNYDDESMNKFEKDIYVVHENLDRIKRNINAMQNFQSKLYFHKLITSAVKDAQKHMKQN